MDELLANEWTHDTYMGRLLIVQLNTNIGFILSVKPWKWEMGLFLDFLIQNERWDNDKYSCSENIIQWNIIFWWC